MLKLKNNEMILAVEPIKEESSYTFQEETELVAPKEIRRVTFEPIGCALDRLAASSDAAAVTYLENLEVTSLRNKTTTIKRVIRCANWATGSTARIDVFSSFVEVLVSDQPLSLFTAASSILSSLANLGKDLSLF